MSACTIKGMVGWCDGPKQTEILSYNKDDKKVCRAHDLGSYAQGQGHNQVRGQNRVSAITQKILKQI